MTRKEETRRSINRLSAFLVHTAPAPINDDDLTAVSVFSGAGLSDMGYRLAGFNLCVQVEKEAGRAELGQANFPDSDWLIGDVRRLRAKIIAAYRRQTDRRLALLVATPPCQGMSSSNPGRGKRSTAKALLNEKKNKLLLEVAPLARELQPRVIVIENVRQILTLTTRYHRQDVRVMDLLARRLSDYTFFETVINVADYGIPQTRFRAVVVGVRNDEPWLAGMRDRDKLPWPKDTHSDNGRDGLFPWLTIRQWLRGNRYARLSSRSPEAARNCHPLHFVPDYDADRYLLVSSIPPRSGRSAYENDVCPDCGRHRIPLQIATCPYCGGVLRNRPIVVKNGRARLIKGFDSSYRRMRPNEPASTVTTNSSHIGSDNKIHPWEHRVLSILECADIQSVPRCYDWSVALKSHRSYLIRNVIGEAFPTFFAYLHGKILRALMEDRPRVFSALAAAD